MMKVKKTLGISLSLLLFSAFALGSGLDDPDLTDESETMTSAVVTTTVTTEATTVTTTEPLLTSNAEEKTTTAEESTTTAVSSEEEKAQAFYSKYSEKILSVESATEDNTLSEKEAAAMLAERGFDQNEVKYKFDLNGNKIDEDAVSADSDTKHPLYETLYQTTEGDVWRVFVIGKNVYASALSYNWETATKQEHIFGECDYVVSYSDPANQYFNTVPKASVVTYRAVETINAETLNKLTFEEIEKYEK